MTETTSDSAREATDATCAVCRKPILDELTVRMRDRRIVHLLCWQPSVPSGESGKPADAPAADVSDLGV